MNFIQAPANPLQRLIDVAEARQQGAISVEAVSDERISSYGVVDPEAWHGDVSAINSIVEKPSLAKAPSRFGVIGRYVLPHAVFSQLKQVPMDHNHEIQLTDALQQLIQGGGLNAVQLDGQRFDCGSQAGFVMANLHVAMQDPDLAQLIQKSLSS